MRFVAKGAALQVLRLVIVNTPPPGLYGVLIHSYTPGIRRGVLTGLYP